MDRPLHVIARSLEEETSGCAANAISVWTIPLDETAGEDAELFACLTEDERTRAERYKVARARHQFVTARGTLRQLLGRSLRIPPREVTITYTGAGKPVLADSHSGLHFNVTHTDGLALIAFANQPVGIDVERVRTLADPAGLVKRFFSAAESAAYLALPPELQPAGFFRGWTSKEAIIKAAAMSVACLEEFDVELHPARPAGLLATRNATLQSHAWGMAAWEPAPGFAAAVALRMAANEPG